MKKLLTFVLAILLALTLGACKAKDDGALLSEVSDVDVPEFMVKICGAKITNKDMENYKLYKGTSDTTNSQGNKKSNEFVGYKFSDVLEVAGVTNDIQAAQIICSDGYEMTYEGNIKAEGVLLAITKDGETFKDGPWFAPLTSDTTGDFAQDLTKVEVDGITSPLAKDSKETKDDANSEEIAFPQDPVCEDKTDKIKFSDFSFKINGQEITNADLEGMNIFRITVVTKNSKDVVSQSKYSGYVLKDVLAKLNINGTKVKTIASDGYESEFSEEMVNSNLTIIAIEKDKETGKDGTVWVAPCNETASSAYAKEIIEITVK